MPVDPKLLELAIERREALERVQDEAERARSSFHRAVRHLHVDGAPLREIAEALGLSHQRVHQIVGDADPVPAEETDGDRKQLACSFCGRPQKTCSKLIAGPAVYICDLCTPMVGQVSQGATSDQFRLADDARTHCHFCGKKKRRVDWVVLAPDRDGASICNECLALIEEILREEDGGAPVPART